MSVQKSKQRRQMFNGLGLRFSDVLFSKMEAEVAEAKPATQSPRWTNEQTKTFLHHLGMHPCLWPDQPTTKKKRMRAKKQIAVALGMRTKVVHQKIITLTGQYQRETKRIALNPTRRRYAWYDEAGFLAKNEDVEFILATADQEADKEVLTSYSTECETKAIHPEMCRVCLVPIDDPYAIYFQEFSTQFTDCTGFAGSMSYVGQPALICADCRDELQVCWTFLERAKRTELILQEKLLPEDTIADESKIKIESLRVKEEPSHQVDQTQHYMTLEIEMLGETSEPLPKPEEPLYIVCHVCGKSINKQYLNRHMSTNHNNNQTVSQRFECDYCGRSYKEKAGLSVHIRKQINEKRFKCQFCDKRFLNWGTCRFHIRSKHMVEKPFHCHLCGKGFLTKTKMIHHIQGDHGNAIWECGHCGKTFNRKVNFQVHVKLVHGNPTPLACDVCGKEFKTKRYLKQHYVIHTGEKNYICPVELCGKAFAQNHVLRSHVEKIHPEAIDELPPPGTIVSIRAVERLKEMQNIDFVKTVEFF